MEFRGWRNLGGIINKDSHLFTETTSSLGTYSIGGVPTGSYTVTPSLSGYTFSPASQSVSVNGTYATANFTGTPPGNTYTISGTFTIMKRGSGLVLCIEELASRHEGGKAEVAPPAGSGQWGLRFMGVPVLSLALAVA
ncbi:MAG: carboxypeptidase-like regulatory domain-containing protein [Acidobacteriota bacterium]